MPYAQRNTDLKSAVMCRWDYCRWNFRTKIYNYTVLDPLNQSNRCTCTHFMSLYFPCFFINNMPPLYHTLMNISLDFNHGAGWLAGFQPHQLVFFSIFDMFALTI